MATFIFDAYSRFTKEALKQRCRELCQLSMKKDFEIDRLKAAVERMGIGVNHIATYRTDRWPDYGTACDAALETLGAGQEYDMWCCWNAAMCARDALADSHGQDAATSEKPVR